MGRVLAVDFGMARIGLARSDPDKIIATALPFLPTKKTLEATVEAFVHYLASQDIEKIVVGNPLKLNGTASPMSHIVEQFVALVKSEVAIPVVLWDERLTTCQAEKALSALSRKKRSTIIDGAAAVILLQSFLDSPRAVV